MASEQFQKAGKSECEFLLRSARSRIFQQQQPAATRTPKRQHIKRGIVLLWTQLLLTIAVIVGNERKPNSPIFFTTYNRS